MGAVYLSILNGSFWISTLQGDGFGEFLYYMVPHGPTLQFFSVYSPFGHFMFWSTLTQLITL